MTDAVRPTGDGYGQADFTSPEQGPLPDALNAREQWMTRQAGDKTPFAPWTDLDAPVECNHADHDTPTTCDECDHSARWKWGDTANYRDGPTAAEWAGRDPRLAGRVFLQQEADPFAFVDGDDVRDPATGRVHPAFVALLERLGASYTEVSTWEAFVSLAKHDSARGDAARERDAVADIALWRPHRGPAQPMGSSSSSGSE